MNDCCTALPLDHELPQLFALGLLTSAGHCLGMCGPLVGAFASRQRETVRSRIEFAGGMAWYQVGRIGAYAALGCLLGAAGGVLSIGESALRWQGGVSLVAAVVLATVGLGLLRRWPSFDPSAVSSFGVKVVGCLGGIAGARSIGKRLALGAVNGLLPCGPVYAVAVTALTSADWRRGILSLAVFGLGTTPLLVAFALGLRWMGVRARLAWVRASAVLVLLLAVQLGLRGMAGLQWVEHLRIGEVVLW